MRRAQPAKEIHFELPAADSRATIAQDVCEMVFTTAVRNLLRSGRCRD